MAKRAERDLSRRERQIMAVIFRHGEASIADIADEIPDAPSDGALRTLLRILERKGHVTRRKEGRRHLYAPRTEVKTAGISALQGVLDTFFGGSLGEAVATHLSDGKPVDEAELERLKRLIRSAKKGGR